MKAPGLKQPITTEAVNLLACYLVARGVDKEGMKSRPLMMNELTPLECIYTVLEFMNSSVAMEVPCEHSTPHTALVESQLCALVVR